MLNKYI